METLAYLHLALAYEVPKDGTHPLTLEDFQIGEWLKPQTLMRPAWIYWLSLAIALSILGMANEALAQQARRGDRGFEVTQIQDRLRELRYFDRSSTGFFGSITEEAVRRFQRDFRLVVDGIVGPQTEAALFDRPVTSTPITPNFPDSEPLAFGDPLPNVLQRGDRGPVVRRLQERLREQGFNPGPIDGIFGPQTERAVRDFQRARNLFVDGIAGRQTLTALRLTTQDPYVVVVPIRDDNTLSQVRQFISGAFATDSNRGNYVNAGAFTNRNDAESRSFYLRARGLDARVAYRP